MTKVHAMMVPSDSAIDVGIVPPAVAVDRGKAEAGAALTVGCKDREAASGK